MATVGGSLTARAILSREILRDDFTRTTSPNDWGSDYVLSYIKTGGEAWVDGSVGRVTAGSYAYFTFADQSKRIHEGFVQFDFWVPANINDHGAYVWITQGDEYPVGIEAYMYRGKLEAGVYYYYSSTDPYHSIIPTVSTWYRVKAFFNGTPGGPMAVKIWKVGDPEPDTFGAVGSISEFAEAIVDPADWFDLEINPNAPDAEPIGFDNLVFGDYGQPYQPTITVRFTAGAIRRKAMPTKLFTVDAYITPLGFSASAWIVGGRSGHSRFWDHYGTQPDTVVVIDGAISPHPSGTTVHAVLEDLIARITALEIGNHVVQSFALGAWIQPYLRASAVLFKTMTVHVWNNNLPFPFKADAVLVHGKTDQPITLDAAIVRSPEAAATMDAYLIDLVC